MSSIDASGQAELSRIVVLGATGRIGRLIRPHWIEPATTWQARRPVGGCETVSILDDPSGVQALLDGASAVICLAGVTPAPDADMALNTALAQAVLDGAQAAQAGPVLLTSSSAVYGSGAGPHHEDGPTTPLSEYATSKRDMEQIALGHAHPSCALRIGNVAGADAVLGKWTPDMTLDQASDGHAPRRSYIGPATLARVLGILARTPDLPECLNIAAPGVISMDALLDAAGLPFGYRKPHAGMIPKLALDTKRLETYVRFAKKESTAAEMVAQWQQSTQHS